MQASDLQEFDEVVCHDGVVRKIWWKPEECLTRYGVPIIDVEFADGTTAQYWPKQLVQVRDRS